MKTTELREMSDEQLTHEVRQAQQELFRLRFQSATERLDAPSSLTKLRRTIARIKTVQREREIAAQRKKETAGGKA
jgi:large subunit ribosomal protein L29